MSHKILILLFLTALAASQNVTEVVVSSPTNSTVAPNGLTQGSEWVFNNYTVTCTGSNTTTRSFFPTATLALNVINLTLADLPKPYATESAQKYPDVTSIPDNATLNVPAGFQVNIFASNLNASRWLALTPDGNLLVTQTNIPNILLMKDTDGDGVADEITEFANADNGLDQPFGMAFSDGYFYLGNSDGIVRFNYTVGQPRLEGMGETIVELPANGNHFTRNVRVSPDGQYLYITVGSAENVGVEPLPRASVQRTNLDGSNQTTFAYGLRNPNGLDFHPVTHEVHTVVNERDDLGDGLVPDYFTRIQEGQFYGWPYVYLSPDNVDPRLADNFTNGTNSTIYVSINETQAAKTVTPDVLFAAHSAALGMQFYNGTAFPVEYQNGAFVAFHGSWNKDSATGYKVVFVPFDETNRPIGDYEDFVTGFVIDPSVPSVWGRPVGILVLPDQSLIFTDDANGRIYRVSYQPGLNCTTTYPN